MGEAGASAADASVMPYMKRDGGVRRETGPPSRSASPRRRGKCSGPDSALMRSDRAPLPAHHLERRSRPSCARLPARLVSRPPPIPAPYRPIAAAALACAISATKCSHRSGWPGSSTRSPKRIGRKAGRCSPRSCIARVNAFSSTLVDAGPRASSRFVVPQLHAPPWSFPTEPHETPDRP